MVEGNRISQIFFLDYEGNIHGGLRPTLVRTNSVVDHIEVNLSNEEFLPAKSPKKILKHIIIMAPTDEVPSCVAAKGTAEVPSILLDSVAWENATLIDVSKMTLFALKLSVLGGYGKGYVDGMANARPCLDSLKQEYGDNFTKWVETVIGAVDHYAAIMVILHKIEEDDHLSLRDMFGEDANDAFNILEYAQFLLSHITPLMQTTYPDSENTRRALLGPYKSVAAPDLPATFPPSARMRIH